MKFLFSLFALMMLTDSCNSSEKAIETTNIKKRDMAQSTFTGSYILTHIENTEAVSKKLTIMFDEKSNKVTGFAGCNSFFGTYTVQNSDITFNNISTSKKFCRKDIIDAERQFLNALNRVNTFTVKDDVLSLLENDTTLLKGTKPVATKKSDIVKGNYNNAITYQSSTRGSFEFINISESNILISTDRSLKTKKQYNCEEKDWEALNKMIEAVDLETFQKLKAPTDKRLFDGAAHATLAIQFGDVEYMTPTFDHGNAPKEIEALVNKVLSIKENVVKQ